jgi:hypothetical protein
MKIRIVWLVLDVIFTIFFIVIIALTALLVSPWYWILIIPVAVFIPFYRYSKDQEERSKKRKYVELVYFIIIEVILLIITFFLPNPWNIVMIAIIIAIPVTIILVSVLDALFQPTFKEYDSRATQVEFLQAQPYFCETCKTFLTTLRETCENCGAKNSLRKATKKDYKQYIGQSK